MSISSISKLNYWKLIKQNVRLNGLTSSVYTYGLSSARFIEYTTTMRWLEKESATKILDVGCGHSLIPSLFASMSFDIVTLDLGKNSMIWQKARAPIESVLASALNLPFKDESFSAVICISVLEHIRDDSRAVKEIARVLKTNGVCIMSVPISQNGGLTNDPLFGVPNWCRYIFGDDAIQVLLKKLNVDRGYTYFERFYSREDILQRIIKSSTCLLEEFIVYWDWIGTKVIFRIIPKSSLALLELFLAKASCRTSSPTHLGGIILKLRKNRVKHVTSFSNLNVPAPSPKGQN